MAAALALPAAAAARTVTPLSGPVVSAHTAVSSCGSLTGVTLSWTTVSGNVATVALSSIPAACAGSSLSLTLAGTGDASIASAGPATVTGATQTFTSISGSPPATSVTGAYISVVGP